jgi:hypothetical protein
MDTDGPGFAADALLQVESRNIPGGPAGDDTISAAGGTSLPAIFPAFVVPAEPALPPDSVAGSLSFADPQAFVLSDPVGAGLPSAAQMLAPDLAGALTVVEHSMPAGAVTAVLQDGTRLSFADLVAAPHGG